MILIFETNKVMKYYNIIPRLSGVIFQIDHNYWKKLESLWILSLRYLQFLNIFFFVTHKKNSVKTPLFLPHPR